MTATMTPLNKKPEPKIGDFERTLPDDQEPTGYKPIFPGSPPVPRGEAPPAAHKLLMEVVDVLAKRQQLYGDIQPFAEALAARQSIGLGYKITPRDALMLMVDFKRTRLQLAPDSDDRKSLVDIVGYLAQLAELK